jgi:transposase-like protein
MNTIKIIQKYQSNEACSDFLCQLRWNTDKKCPYCQSEKVSIHTEKGRRSRLQCSACKVSFSPTVNTMMHNSKVPLFKWFLAISMLSEAKKSISSRQLARHLDLPVKTAYALCQRVRKGLLGTRSPLLKGIIEMDETYIGGKPRHPNLFGTKRGRGTKKTMVVGAIERGGSVIAKMAEQYRGKNVRDMILENVDIEKSKIYSDEYGIYNKVKKLTPHDFVNHGRKQYVRGNVHTNTIEGFWASVKRALYGQHHHYSKQYTPLYIAEAAFKYNNRHNDTDTVFNNAMNATLCLSS